MELFERKGRKRQRVLGTYRPSLLLAVLFDEGCGRIRDFVAAAEELTACVGCPLWLRGRTRAVVL